MPGNGPALLGMPDKETLDILIINCNTIDMQRSGEQISRKEAGKLGCTNKIQSAEAQTQCNANTDGILSDNTNPVLTDDNNDRTNYFLPSPNQDADRRTNAEMAQQLQKKFKDEFIGKACFDGTFSLKVKQTENHIRYHKDA